MNMDTNTNTSRPACVELDEPVLQALAVKFPLAAMSIRSHKHGGLIPLSPSEWTSTLPDRSAQTIERALLVQLGTPWRGIHEENSPRQAMLRLLALYALHDVPAFHRALECLNAGVPPDNLRMTTNEMEQADEFIERVALGHAWSSTVALAVIRRAKNANGVLPSAWFMALHDHDHHLWLLLQNYGRREPVVEVLGTVAHEAAERIMGMPLPSPIFDAPVQAVLSACQP